MSRRVVSDVELMSEEYADSLAKEIMETHKEQFAEGRIPLTRWKKFLSSYARTSQMIKSLETASISPRSFYEWKNNKPWFQELMQELEEVMVEKCIDTSIRISTEGTDPNFLKWFLSKMRPEKYGDKIVIDGNMVHTMRQMTEAELLKILERGDE